MVDRLRTMTGQVSRRFLEPFSATGINLKKEKDRHSKERVEKLLQRSKEEGEIVDFLPTFSLNSGNNGQDQQGKTFSWPNSDFLIILIMGSRHEARYLLVKNFQRGADKFRKKDKEKRQRFRKSFIEIPVLVAGSKISDRQLERNWQKILSNWKSLDQS